MVSIKKLNNPESSDSTLGENKMANRIGKYKVSKKESVLSLKDGGTAEGAITFNGNIQTGATATGAAAGGSAAGTLSGKSNAGTIDVTTQLANTNTYTVTFGTAYTTAPNCIVVGLTNYTWAESTSALTITATGNTGTGDLNYVCF